MQSNWRDRQCDRPGAALGSAPVFPANGKRDQRNAKHEESMFEHAPPSAGAVRALAHQLLTWADHLPELPSAVHEMTEEDRHDLVLRLALAMREARCQRTRILPAAPLGNPNWDVMLDLFIQEMNGFRTSLDHLSLGGELPAHLVHECVEEMVALGLIERTADRFDSHVAWLSLSARGRQGMFDLFTRTAEFVRPGPRRIEEREFVNA